MDIYSQARVTVADTCLIHISHLKCRKCTQNCSANISRQRNAHFGMEKMKIFFRRLDWERIEGNALTHKKILALYIRNCYETFCVVLFSRFAQLFPRFPFSFLFFYRFVLCEIVCHEFSKKPQHWCMCIGFARRTRTLRLRAHTVVQTTAHNRDMCNCILYM